MNPFAALDQQSPALLSLMLLLLGAFIAAYTAAVTRLLGRVGRLRAACIALVAGGGFCSTFAPWTIAVLLLAGAVGGVGVFIATTWTVSRLLGLRGHASALPKSEGVEIDDVGNAPASTSPRTPAAATRAPSARPTAPAPLG